MTAYNTVALHVFALQTTTSVSILLDFGAVYYRRLISIKDWSEGPHNYYQTVCFSFQPVLSQ